MATTAGLPTTVIAPAVIFVAVAVTLNSPAPGVPVTLFNCVIPLYTCISVPDPVYVAALAAVGLDSLRVSLNSAREEVYNAYYRPNNYTFADIKESIRVMSAAGKWTSINYFVFPGMTDSVAEYEALRQLIIDTDLKMIQWRNFNIDPDWYLGKIGFTEMGEIMGIKQMMELIQEEFPNLKFGYYNPPIERIKGDFSENFAHH